MKIFAEHDRRFEGLERKTGLFVLLAALLTAAVVVAALYRQGVFTQTTHLHFFAPSAQGIGKGMAVQLFGFKIGTVDSLSLEPTGAVRVKLVVASEYLRLINQDSVARLAKEGLLGAGIIEIVPARTASRPVPENGVLKFERSADFSSVAEELSEQLKPILADIKQITESFNKPDGDIRQTFKNARAATAELAALARNTDRQLASVLGKADTAFAKASTTLDTVSGGVAQLPELMLKLERTLTNLEAVSVDAKKLSAAAVEDLPPTLREARALAEDGRVIVDGAKRAWPIRTFIAEPREQALPLDSFDGAGTQVR